MPQSRLRESLGGAVLSRFFLFVSGLVSASLFQNDTLQIMSYEFSICKYFHHPVLHCPLGEV